MTEQPLSQWMEHLRCPHCRESLIQTGDSLQCESCTGWYPLVHEIPRLLDADRAEAYEEFCERFDALRLKEGWASDDPSYYSALPYHDKTGNHTEEWRLRIQSFELVERWLKRTYGSDRKAILDIGAGNGWLSRLLSDRYDMVAMDVNAGRHGLNSIPAEQRQYTTIQGNLERIPLEDACIDIAIANAAIHYTRNPEQYLQEVHRVLKPDGAIVVMDSPVYPTEEGAEEAYKRTVAYFQQMGVPELTPYYGGLVSSFFREPLGFRFHCLRQDFSWSDRLKKRLRETFGKSEAARFPVWVGKK